MTVNVGDKVRVTCNIYPNKCPEGTVCTVVDAWGGDGIKATVDGGEGFEWYLRSGWYEPITTTETGTLQELNVKPGDVVEHVGAEGMFFNRYQRGKITDDMMISTKTGYEEVKHICHPFRIISRASDDDTPKKWGDMSDEEKGALLLAHHEGKVIEVNAGDGWHEIEPIFKGSIAYRIKPEPVRETRLVQIRNLHDKLIGYGDIDYINGEPDLDTIKMERI